MNRKKPATEVPFLSAIRRGMSSEVVRQMDGWLFSQRTFYDENDEQVYPFLLALDHQRWAVALDILEHRHANPELLPPPYEVSEDYPSDVGPAAADTEYARAVNSLLSALSKTRPVKPLPKPLMERLDRLMEPLVERYGKEDTLVRAVAYGPRWLTWADQLLDQGANPNAYFVGKVSGNTIHMLDIAGRFCAKSVFDRLLDSGSNPWYKHHDMDLAAHRIADIEKWTVDRHANGVPKLEDVLIRRQCLNRLMAIEGMGQAKGRMNETPEQVWQRGMAWLANEGERNLSGAELSQWQAKRMEVLSFQDLPVSPNRPKRRL